MRTFDLTGVTGITLQFSGTLLNTARTIPPVLLSPPSPYYIHFNSGNPALLNNASLTGDVSGATVQLVETFVSAGTLAASTAVGVMFVSSPTGTITEGESFVNSVSASACSPRSGVITIPGWRTSLQALAAFLQVETDNLRVTWCGKTATDNTASLASFGFVLTPYSTLEVKEENKLRNLSFISENTASPPTVTLTLSY